MLFDKRPSDRRQLWLSDGKSLLLRLLNKELYAAVARKNDLVVDLVPHVTTQILRRHRMRKLESFFLAACMLAKFSCCEEEYLFNPCRYCCGFCHVLELIRVSVAAAFLIKIAVVGHKRTQVARGVDFLSLVPYTMISTWSVAAYGNSRNTTFFMLMTRKASQAKTKWSITT